MMETGSLAEHNLEDAILKRIGKKDKIIIAGSEVGNDYSASATVVFTEGTGSTPSVAWNKGLNNFLCSMGEIHGARITMLLPSDTKESEIKQYMEEFLRLSESAKVPVAGGHTEILKGNVRAHFIVSFAGVKGEYLQSRKSIVSGNDIVMAGYAGGLATDIIIDNHKERLAERFDGMYIEAAYGGTDSHSVKGMIDALKSDISVLTDDIYYIHDGSYGGIYSALWQLGKWTGKGFEIDNRKIPIKQETIEICECFDVNPYLMDATGSLLLVCKSGKRICEALKQQGISAAIIGKVSAGKERLVRFGDEDVRTLAPVSGDEINKLL